MALTDSGLMSIQIGGSSDKSSKETKMRRSLGRFLLGLRFTLTWPIQIGCFAYGIYYIVHSSINAGFIGGLMAFSIVAVCFISIHFSIVFISKPLRSLASSFMQAKKGTTVI